MTSTTFEPPATPVAPATATREETAPRATARAVWTRLRRRPRRLGDGPPRRDDRPDRRARDPRRPRRLLRDDRVGHRRLHARHGHGLPARRPPRRPARPAQRPARRHGRVHLRLGPVRRARRRRTPLIAARALQGLAAARDGPAVLRDHPRAVRRRGPAARVRGLRPGDGPGGGRSARCSAARSSTPTSSDTGWRAIFLINVPVGLAAIAIGRNAPAAHRARRRPAAASTS